ncbi:MAG TPA: zf-HC2 domain-containing protein [Myxococcaceae bacterium]|jgi:anti-sigma factor RsiW|nr:zf-HC2 domain-containing protein [Myxococcaceae bacterium]
MSLNPATLQLLSAYVDGELTAAERETVERALVADPRLRELERSMRGLGSAVRALSDAEVTKADFSGLADRVMARVSRRPGFLDRVREAWRRPWLPVGGLVAVAAAAFFIFGPAASTGPTAPGVVVQSASADSSQNQLQPVVLKTETGDAIIWLVDTPDASGNHRPTVLPPDKPGVQAPVPAQQRPRAGEL